MRVELGAIFGAEPFREAHVLLGHCIEDAGVPGLPCGFLRCVLELSEKRRWKVPAGSVDGGMGFFDPGEVDLIGRVRHPADRNPGGPSGRHLEALETQAAEIFSAMT